MKALHRAALAVLTFSLPALIWGCASQGAQAQIKASRLAKSGETVQLQSYPGDKTAQDQFCLNGTATVYRFFPPWAAVHERDEVAQVRITRVLSDRTLEAVVLEGRVLNGDKVLQRYADCTTKGI